MRAANDSPTPIEKQDESLDPPETADDEFALHLAAPRSQHGADAAAGAAGGDG